MKILTLENATKEELEGVYFRGDQSTLDLLKSKGLTPLLWIQEQDPPLKTALSVKDGLIDFNKYENMAADDQFISFEERVKSTLPHELIFRCDTFDWIGTSATLHEVKGNYAYYTHCKGCLSKIFDVHIPEMEKEIGSSYFLSRDSLVDFVLKKHADAIEFIQEQRDCPTA